MIPSIPSSSSGLVGLRNICLNLEVAIKFKGQTLTRNSDAEGAAPTNNFIHSCFKQCSRVWLIVCVNILPISDYMESLLSYTVDAQSGQPTSCLFIKDTGGSFSITKQITKRKKSVERISLDKITSHIQGNCLVTWLKEQATNHRCAY